MKRITFFSTLFCMFLLSSCCVPFSHFYTPYTDTENLSDVTLLKPEDKPKIFFSENLNDDLQEILSNHYYCIGSTNFNGAWESRKNIIKGIKHQCRITGATLAIYGCNYTHTETSNIMLPQLQTTWCYPYHYWGHSFNTIKLKDYIYSIPKYNHTVYYFVKFTSKAKLRFGIEYADLTSKSREKYKRNTGVLVSVVYKDTPAFNENILVGDVIIKVNNHNIKNASVLDEIIAASKSGDLFEIKVQRNFRIRTIKVNLD